MNISEKHIVAIDLGTSKIALTVAKVNGEDVQIIYYKEIPASGIRYSYVFNESYVTKAVTQAIAMAEEELGLKITSAVVGMPKYPIVQESNTAKMEERGEDCDITTEDIICLKKFAEESYPLKDVQRDAIYGAVAQSFTDGENFQIIEEDIIGMTGDTVEGNFKIFIGNKRSLNKIDHVMNRVHIPAIRKYFTADSTARAILTESEMENGVALIDFGGGCTSVSIYHGNIMRHYASIPFGGKNITADIKTECQISESLAENIKLAFGACMPEKLQNLGEKIIHIRSNGADPDKQLPVKYLSEIISARIEEILMAIFYEIEKSTFADKLRSGIVITGGVAQTANLGSFIYDISGYKVRTGYPKGLFSAQGCDGIVDTSATASIGLILKALEDGNINCAISSDEVGVNPGCKIEVTPAGEAGADSTNDTTESSVDNFVDNTSVEPETEEEQNPDGILFKDMPDVVEDGHQQVKKHKTSSPKEKKPKITWTSKIVNTLFNWYETSNDESSEA